MQVWLIELQQVDAGSLEVAKFFVDDGGIRQGQCPLIWIVTVVSELAERERPGHGDFRAMCCIGDEKLGGSELDRELSVNLAIDEGNVGLAATAVDADSDLGPRHPAERACEMVEVALAPHFSVGDDVHAGVLLVGDRHQRRRFDRLVEVVGRHLPEAFVSHTGHTIAEQSFLVNEPSWLRVAPHDGGGDHRRSSRSVGALRVPVAQPTYWCDAHRNCPPW